MNGKIKENGRARITPIASFNREKRLELAKLLIEAGFAVREAKEREDGKTVYFVEFWVEK